MGKTTITNSNKERFFDREFFESRTVIGMPNHVIDKIFNSFADIIELQYQYGSQDCYLSAFKAINHSQLKGVREDAKFTARYIERDDLEQGIEME